MASGAGNLPYPGKAYSPFDILTAEELNEDVANIERLADGTGIGDGAVTAQKIDFATLAFGNYSTAEVNTGFKWIDGKAVYKKTINVGAMPNATSKLVAHGITGIDIVLSIYGAAASTTAFIPLPYVIGSAVSADIYYQIDLSVQGDSIRVRSGANSTAYTRSFVTLHYTKT